MIPILGTRAVFDPENAGFRFDPETPDFVLIRKRRTPF